MNNVFDLIKTAATVYDAIKSSGEPQKSEVVRHQDTPMIAGLKSIQEHQATLARKHRVRFDNILNSNGSYGWSVESE